MHKLFTKINLTLFDTINTIIILSKSSAAKSAEDYGAEDGTRTHDLLITNQLLYQLSHSSTYYKIITATGH